MTDASIISQAKANVRENGTTLDTTLLAWLNRIQRTYSRRFDFPQLRVLGATLSTTANTATIDLAATFDRLMGKSVVYNPTAITGGYTGGIQVPVLESGDPRLDEAIALWKFAGSGDPQVATISSKSGTPATLQLVLYPFPTTASITIVYNYYRTPTALINAPTSIDVDKLGEVFVAALSKELAVYLNSKEKAPYFAKQERDEWNAVLRTLYTA